MVKVVITFAEGPNIQVSVFPRTHAAVIGTSSIHVTERIRQAQVREVDAISKQIHPHRNPKIFVPEIKWNKGWNADGEQEP